MGHGSEHYANMAYAALDYMFKQKGYSQIYVGTVEAYPSLEHILCGLPGKGHKENPSGAPYDRGRGSCHQ